MVEISAILDDANVDVEHVPSILQASLQRAIEQSVVIQNMATDLDSLKTRIDDLKTDVTDLKTNVADLKTNVADLKTNGDGLKTSVAEVLIFMKKEKEKRKARIRAIREIHPLLRGAHRPFCVPLEMLFDIFDYDSSDSSGSNSHYESSPHEGDVGTSSSSSDV